jgi:hypothetical protein
VARKKASDLLRLPRAALLRRQSAIVEHLRDRAQRRAFAGERLDDQAQNNLGLIYWQGQQGVLQNYAEAVKLFRKAADQGVAQAQYNLGLMYQYGQGVAQDYAEAHMRLNLEAAAGYEEVGRARDWLAAIMTPDQIAKAQRRAREWKPTK